MKIVILVALALLLGSCEKRASDPPAIERRVSDGVELLSTGSQPMRLLRYRLAKGATSPLELAMDLDLDAGGRGGKMPTLILSLTIAIEEVLADGSANIKSTVDKAAVKEREGSTVPLEAVSNMTQMLTGMIYTATLSPDGTLSNTKIVGPQQKMARELSQFTQSLEQVAMRLPAVPVGVGAKWIDRKTNTQNDTQNEMTMTTVTTITLSAIDGDKVSFTSTSTVSAPDQMIQQGAIRATIRDIGGGGSGKGVVDLSKMTMTGEVNAEFRGTTMVTQGEKPGNVRVAMKLTMQ